MSREQHKIGGGSATLLVVANMLGAGVFTASGFALADLPSRAGVMAAWAVGGVLALFGALSYRMLVRRFPGSGGEYLFLSRAVHPLAGFLAGWISLLAGFTAPIAVSALAFAAYLRSVVNLPVSDRIVATAVILVAAAAHGIRLRIGLNVQNVVVTIKLAAIAVFLVAGLIFMGTSAPPPEPAPTGSLEFGAFMVILIWVSFAYSGWNAAVYLSEEVHRPGRTVPRALVMGTVLVMLLYLALNGVFVYSAPVEALAGRPDVAAVAANALGGPALGRALSGLVVLSLFTSVSSMMMVGPRVYDRMARDGIFPNWLAHRHGVPTAAIALQAVLTLAAVWAGELRSLLGYIGFALGLCAAASVIAGMVVCRREGSTSMMPGYPWLPATFVAFTTVAAIFLAIREPLQAGIGLLTVAAGIPVYLWMRVRST
jgi:APA family basic amino acid/polyamine antiporter